MSLVKFNESNCYYSCIINCASFLISNYENAFSDLWSENDFLYSEKHSAYLTKNMFRNLESLGAKFEVLDISSGNTCELNLAKIPINDWIIIGMDAFHIPWTPYYKLLHSEHYFLIKKIQEKSFFCLDPTYNKPNLNISFEEITSNAFDICYIRKSKERNFNPSPYLEAQKIILTHPETTQILLTKIKKCNLNDKANSLLFVKYIDALIYNRHLYKHYLGSLSINFFNDDFFMQWQAVKNGLYKASLMKNNRDVINDVCTHLSTLMKRETTMAQEILSL